MVTTQDLEPIVSAVPSFRRAWEELLQPSEDPTLDDPTIIDVEFSTAMTKHLVTQAHSGDFSDFSLLFAALEGPLSGPNAELYDSLTSGFLNQLMSACEDCGIDLSRVAACIPGPTTQFEWSVSYRWTHQDKEPSWL
jgi:hypothetical protein